MTCRRTRGSTRPRARFARRIPARDKDASARLFAEVFGLQYAGPSGWYAAVRVNDSLKLAFVDYAEPLDSHHYAFLVDDEELDAILERVQWAGVAYGSDSENAANGELNSFNGGRGFYFLDLDGHLIELLTSPQHPTLGAGPGGRALARVSGQSRWPDRRNSP